MVALEAAYWQYKELDAEVSGRFLVAAVAESVAELYIVLESGMMPVATESVQKWVIMKMVLENRYLLNGYLCLETQ